MYSIYTTEGIILSATYSKEADRVYRIFTKEFGLILAEAKGVRKIDSKLRYSLQLFSLADFSLVRGKDKWRITSASLKKNIFFDLNGYKDCRAIFCRVASLILRLIHGEEKNELLFEYLKKSAEFLIEKKPADAVLQSFEYLSVLRVLHALGYLGDTAFWRAFLDNPSFEEELLSKISLNKKEAISAINKSIKESHL